jgi:hypothetical protein
MVIHCVCLPWQLKFLPYLAAELKCQPELKGHAMIPGLKKTNEVYLYIQSKVYTGETRYVSSSISMSVVIRLFAPSLSCLLNFDVSKIYWRLYRLLSHLKKLYWLLSHLKRLYWLLAHLKSYIGYYHTWKNYIGYYHI